MASAQATPSSEPKKMSKPSKPTKKRVLPKPKQILPIKSEEEDPNEDVLDRFSHPEKKRQRKEKKHQQEEEKKSKLVNHGKRLAAEEFNSPPSDEDVQMWQKYVEQPVPGLEDLKRLQAAADEMTIDSIGYKSLLAKTDGFFAVMDCLNCMLYCTDWIKERLARVGWKINMTGYEPTAVSHSKMEVLNATLECYRMSIKQMILLVQHPSNK